jgi:hypothetical protein
MAATAWTSRAGEKQTEADRPDPGGATQPLHRDPLQDTGCALCGAIGEERPRMTPVPGA